jgi:hypothetical protein
MSERPFVPDDPLPPSALLGPVTIVGFKAGRS